MIASHEILVSSVKNLTERRCDVSRGRYRTASPESALRWSPSCRRRVKGLRLRNRSSSFSLSGCATCWDAAVAGRVSGLDHTACRTIPEPIDGARALPGEGHPGLLALGDPFSEAGGAAASSRPSSNRPAWNAASGSSFCHPAPPSSTAMSSGPSTPTRKSSMPTTGVL